jgi:hypothetical protein
MTIGSVAAATFFLLVLVVGGAAYGWANAVTVQCWYWLFIVVLLVLVFATVARPPPGLIHRDRLLAGAGRPGRVDLQDL